MPRETKICSPLTHFVAVFTLLCGSGTELVIFWSMPVIETTSQGSYENSNDYYVKYMQQWLGYRN